MQFEHGFQENYTTTVTRWVGPTTEVGVRGTLPQPSPDDTNAIWLAKNGSDASAGTQAGPKLTLAGAIAALTATKKTIHIFRNGYVGDLLFTQSSTQTLPASRNIQVEEGEIGILKNTFAGTHLELFGQNSLNGLIIYNHHMGSFVTNIILIIGSEINIDNCSIYAINPNWSSAGIIINDPLLNNIHVNYSILRTTTGIQCYVNNSIIIENNIFMKPFNNEIKSNFINSTVGINIIGTASTSFTTHIIRCYFISLNIAIVIENFYSAYPGNEIIIEGCLFEQTNYAIFYLVPDPEYLTIICNYLLNHSFHSLLFDGVYASQIIPPNLTIINNNELDKNTTLLWINAVTAIVNRDAELMRLQFKGKTSPNGNKYLIDSPLINAFQDPTPDEDLNPWDEDTILTSRTFNTVTTLSNSAAALTITPEFQNPVEKNDVNGNLHNDYDAIRRRFELAFGDDYALTNEEQWNLMAMAADRSSKRFYEIGIGTTLFDDSSSGTFSDADNSFTPVITIEMITDHWRGYWLIIQDGSVFQHYYINSNDDTKLYLSNKIESGFPANGTYDFTIEYILVKSPLEAIIQSQKYFTNLQKGGRWRERTPDNRENYQYTIDKLTLMEVEDLEEG